MLESFARNWWVIALRGLVAIVFGIIALVSPQSTILALVLVFAAFIVADGFLTLFSGFETHKEDNRWWVMVLGGLVEIILGVLVVVWPQITVQVFVYLVAAWAVITGVAEIIAGIELRGLLPNEWLMLLNGILSVAFGVLVMIYPSAGALSLVWLLGLYAIVAGILDIVFSFRLRGFVAKVEKTFGTGNA